MNDLRTPAQQALAEPVAFPEGYEPHELPADYTGPLWIEGQVRRLYESATPPQRKPLTDEEIMDIVDKERARVAMNEAKVAYRVARAIERAHGIGEQQ